MKDAELKAALLNRDFDRAQALILEWARGRKADIQAAPNPAERQRRYNLAMQAGEECLCLARVLRAHMATELQSNSASFLYSDTDSAQHRWQMQA